MFSSSHKPFYSLFYENFNNNLKILILRNIYGKISPLILIMNLLSKGLVQDIDHAEMDKCHMWISLGFSHFIQGFLSVKLQNKSCSIEHF